MSPGALAVAFVAALGLAVGSFLNVCIHRLPRRQSIAAPRSHCPACGHVLAWYENLPILSYVVLRGRCRACGGAISARYPLVEAATAGLFLAHYGAIGWEPLLPVRLLFAAALVALFVIDLEHKILPNVITVPGIAVGLAASLALPPGWMASLAGVLLGGGLLLGISEAYYRVRGEEGLGMGDVKMLAMIGAFLGWKLVLVTLVLASLAGSGAGVLLIASGRGTMKYALPFGTFLAAGAVAASLVGERLLGWYLQFY